MNARKTVSLLALLAVVAGLAAAAPAGTTRDDRDPQLYLDLGAAGDYASVGRIDLTIGSVPYLASGTLIAPDWVLTAGHVVSDASTLSFTVGGTTYAASGWQAHRKWNGDLLGGYDIGLVHLSSPVESITPAVRHADGDEFGAEATFVGYGMSGTGLTGAWFLDGQKRAGLNTIDAFYSRNPKKDPLIFLSDFDNPHTAADNAYGSPTPLDLEYLTAPGDSGGGVFVDLGSGLELVGVHSFGASFDGDTNSDYGDLSGNIRVSPFNKWIDAILSGKGKGGSNAGGNGKGKGGGKPNFFDEPAQRVVPLDENGLVPEPATLALLAAGGMLVLRRRRK